LSCLCSFFLVLSTAGQPAAFVSAVTGPFEYLGDWRLMTTTMATGFAGSQVRFDLTGKARLRVVPPASSAIRLVVKNGEDVVWNDLLTTGVIDLDGGTAGSTFTVIHAASNAGQFDPAKPPESSLLRFAGCELAPDAELSPPVTSRTGPVLAFIGDSITAGVRIRGRQGHWSTNSDATRTYAFGLVENEQSRYLMWGIPGAIIETFIALFERDRPPPVFAPPDLVFINLGANQRNDSARHYREKMRTLLQGILRIYPQSRIVLLNFMRMTPNRLPELKALANEFPNGKVRVFDARPFLVGYADSGVHPDEKSHRRLSAALAPLVKVKLASLAAAPDVREGPPTVNE